MAQTVSVPVDQLTVACVDSAEICRRLCQQALPYSLRMGGEYLRCSHLSLLLDTAEICRTLEDFVRRRSEFSLSVCRTAGQICDSFAESCSHMHDDLLMQECATAARDCAAACRNLTEML